MARLVTMLAVVGGWLISAPLVASPPRESQATRFVALRPTDSEDLNLLRRALPKNTNLVPAVRNVTRDRTATPLHRAVSEGQLDEIRQLVEGGAQLEAFTAYLGNPMHVAASGGKPEVVELLLKLGADVDPRRRTGRFTPLHDAANFGHFKNVQILLDAGAEVDAQDDHGRTPLWYAAGHSHRKIVELLLERGANVNLAPAFDITTLEQAALSGDETLVRRLLAAGAQLPETVRPAQQPAQAPAGTKAPPEQDAAQPDIAAKPTIDEETIRRLLATGTARRVLPHAVGVGYLSRVKALLAEAPEVLNEQFERRTLLGHAIEGQQTAIINFLLTQEVDLEMRYSLGGRAHKLEGTALHMAVQQNDEETVKKLLAAGAKVDHDRPGMEMSPLAMACEGGYPRIATLLLDHHANPDAPGRTGVTPLQFAVMRGNTDLVRLLLKHGADANLGSGDSGSPLLMAADFGYEPIIELLVKHGADLKRTAEDGRTILQIAALRGRERIVAMLIKRGFELDLHSATAMGDVRRMAQLLDQDPKLLESRLPDGYTPLLTAVAAQQIGSIELLIERGADLDVRADDGRPPLYLARSSSEITKLLQSSGAKESAVQVRPPADQVAGTDAIEKKDDLAIRVGYITFFPGGFQRFAGPNVYSIVGNDSGQRYRVTESEQPGLRMVIREHPRQGLQIEVTTEERGETTTRQYESWDALRDHAPRAMARYEALRPYLEADLVPGEQAPQAPLDSSQDSSWPFVGLGCRADRQGVLVTTVVPGAAAEKAGLKVEDHVITIAGRKVFCFEAMHHLVARHDIGSPLEFVILRDGKTMTKTITTGNRLTDAIQPNNAQ
jgi:ankyrin repeat protein